MSSGKHGEVVRAVRFDGEMRDFGLTVCGLFRKNGNDWHLLQDDFLTYMSFYSEMMFTPQQSVLSHTVFK